MMVVCMGETARISFMGAATGMNSMGGKAGTFFSGEEIVTGSATVSLIGAQTRPTTSCSRTLNEWTSFYGMGGPDTCEISNDQDVTLSCG